MAKADTNIAPDFEGLYNGDRPVPDLDLPESHTFVPTLADHNTVEGDLGVDAVNPQGLPTGEEIQAEADEQGIATTDPYANAGGAVFGNTADSPSGQAAETVDSYDELTVPELREEAKNRGLEGYSDAKKAELVAMLDKDDEDNPPEADES